MGEIMQEERKVIIIREAWKLCWEIPFRQCKLQTCQRGDDHCGRLWSILASFVLQEIWFLLLFWLSLSQSCNCSSINVILPSLMLFSTDFSSVSQLLIKGYSLLISYVRRICDKVRRLLSHFSLVIVQKTPLLGLEGWAYVKKWE
jgi:hypothetical protein